MANLQDDLGAAIVKLIQTNEARFMSALTKSEGALKVQYIRPDASLLTAGTDRCVVRALAPTINTTSFATSANSTFGFELGFVATDLLDAIKANSLLQQAIISTFADGGDALLDAANFIDNGANVLGKSGRVVIASMDLQPNERAPNMVVLNAIIEVALWHKVPLL